MQKRELYRIIAEKTGLPMKGIEEVFIELGNQVVNLKPGETVRLPWGIFRSKYIKSRKKKLYGREVIQKEKVKITLHSRYMSIFPHDYQWDYVTEDIEEASPSTWDKDNQQEDQNDDCDESYEDEDLE